MSLSLKFDTVEDLLHSVYALAIDRLETCDLFFSIFCRLEGGDTLVPQLGSLSSYNSMAGVTLNLFLDMYLLLV